MMRYAFGNLGIILLVQKYIFIFYVALPKEITKCFGMAEVTKFLKIQFKIGLANWSVMYGHNTGSSLESGTFLCLSD